MTTDSASTSVSATREHMALTYPLGTLQGEGTPFRLADGVYVVRMPLHIGIAYINVYLLEDTDGWYIVDTGLPNDATRRHWHSLANEWFAGTVVKGIVCTHYHYDHAGLAGFLADLFSAPVYMTFGEYYLLRSAAVESTTERVTAQVAFFAAHGTPKDEQDKMAQANLNDPYTQFVPTHFSRLQHGDVWHIGSRQWRIVIGRGHSPEHACLFSDDERPILISGDQLLPEISSNIFVQDTEPNANPLLAWGESLTALHQLPTDTLVCPAHGHPFEGIQLRVQQLRAHHRKTLQRICERAGKVKRFTAYEAMRWLFPKIHRPVDLMLALSETIAHINYLSRTGELVRCPATEAQSERHYMTFRADFLGENHEHF